LYATLEKYEKISKDTLQAIEVISKETEVNYDLLEQIVNDPNFTKFV